ncbi:MAG: DUF4917 family protein [Bacillota bacterium]
MSRFKLLDYGTVRSELGEKQRSHLLLGNGFSIACDKRFNYGNLFEYAKQNGLPQRVLGIFERLGTNNFEGVMRLLEDADWMARHYGLWPEGTAKSEMLADLDLVKGSLVNAVAQIHLEHTGMIDDERKSRCAQFLAPYHNIFTINYDLLLYWVEMHALDTLRGRDGFRADVDDPDAEYVVFREHIGDQKGIFFIHGALHLYVVKGEVRKHTWVRTQKPLIENVRESLERGQYPLFVAEGLAEKKLEQIQRSGYLSYCLGKLERITNALVVFGLSFGDSDRHLADVIANNKSLGTLYVGLYGDPDSALNRIVRQNVKSIQQRRERLIAAKQAKSPLEVKFYDTATAPVWDE